ncbi:MAG: hypothetical protein ACYDDN_02640 [Candidatus Desulforudaceae bacterium]
MAAQIAEPSLPGWQPVGNLLKLTRGRLDERSGAAHGDLFEGI